MNGLSTFPRSETGVAQCAVVHSAGHTGKLATRCILEATADHAREGVSKVKLAAGYHGGKALISVAHSAPDGRITLLCGVLLSPCHDRSRNEINVRMGINRIPTTASDDATRGISLNCV